MKQFLSEPQQALVVLWWNGLQNENGRPAGPFAILTHGDRAQLRRCALPDDVLLLSSLHRLAQALQKADGPAVPLSALALAAGVLSHVTDHIPGKDFARALGSKNGTDRPCMSELRFQQLQTCRDEVAFFRQARRAVDLLGGTTDVGRLANDLLNWVHEYRQPDPALPPAQRLKLRWATLYYQAALPESADEQARQPS